MPLPRRCGGLSAKPEVTTAIFECKQAAGGSAPRQLQHRRDTSAACHRPTETRSPGKASAHSLSRRCGLPIHSSPSLIRITLPRSGTTPISGCVRELNALHTRVTACAKFETLLRYCCANLFFLVLPGELYRESEVPVGWGVLTESDGALDLRRKPSWHEMTADRTVQFLHCIARTGTRALNRAEQITFEEVLAQRSRSYSTTC